MCEALGDPGAERISNNGETGKPDCRGKVAKRIGIVSGARRLRPQIVGQEITRRIPRNQPELLSQADELKPPIQEFAPIP